MTEAPGSQLAVVKVGGSLAAEAGLLKRTGAAIAKAAARHSLVVIPGGGPFAERVRLFDQEHHLSNDAAHWMAILGMDQYAFALCDVIPNAILVEDRTGMLLAQGKGQVPVLAPSRWLRAADELPHTWDVTSDSLSAYLATLLGADQLVLIKPVEGGIELMDPWFGRTVPAGIRWSVLSPDQIDQLDSRLNQKPDLL